MLTFYYICIMRIRLLRRYHLKGIAFVVLLLLCLNNVISQQVVAYVDTSDYFPLPAGLNTNLQIAASKGYVFEVYRLIKLGADINDTDYNGMSALSFAVAFNNERCVDAILSYNPKIDTYNYLGESNLHIAVKNNYIEIAEALIRKNASIDIVDPYRCTPLHYASAYNYLYMTDMLIYYGADPDAKSKDGTTPIMASVWVGNAEVSDLLIQSGANINIADTNGFTPLLIAAQNGDTLITKMLLDAGASVRDKNKYNYDVASIAARNGDEKYLSYLFKSTKWSELRNPEAVRPTTAARNYGKTEVFKILKSSDNGADGRISFDMVNISTGLKFNLHDIYTSFNLSFIEPLYKIRFNLGMDFKPWSTRVLLKDSDNLYYQYFDKRYFPYAGLTKEFVLNDNYFKGKTSLLINANIGYMVVDNYPGTYFKPKNKFRFSPGIYVERTYMSFTLSLGYEYMNTGLYKAGPGWLVLDLGYSIPFKKIQAPLKNIVWY